MVMYVGPLCSIWHSAWLLKFLAIGIGIRIASHLNLRIFQMFMALKNLKTLKLKWAKVLALEKLENH